MKTNLLISLGIFFLVGVGSLAARMFNLYNDYWFTDIILHALSGVGFGFFWLGLQRKTTHWLLLLLGCASLAVFGSVLWEFGEFGAWKFVPAYGPFYTPRLPDTLGDILCGLVGGVMSMIINQYRVSKKN